MHNAACKKNCVQQAQRRGLTRTLDRASFLFCVYKTQHLHQPPVSFVFSAYEQMLTELVLNIKIQTKLSN